MNRKTCPVGVAVGGLSPGAGFGVTFAFKDEIEIEGHVLAGENPGWWRSVKGQLVPDEVITPEILNPSRCPHGARFCSDARVCFLSLRDYSGFRVPQSKVIVYLVRGVLGLEWKPRMIRILWSDTHCYLIVVELMLQWSSSGSGAASGVLHTSSTWIASHTLSGVRIGSEYLC